MLSLKCHNMSETGQHGEGGTHLNPSSSSRDLPLEDSRLSSKGDAAPSIAPSTETTSMLLLAPVLLLWALQLLLTAGAAGAVVGAARSLRPPLAEGEGPDWADTCSSRPDQIAVGNVCVMGAMLVYGLS